MHNDGIKSVDVIEFFLDLLVGRILDVIQRQVFRVNLDLFIEIEGVLQLGSIVGEPLEVDDQNPWKLLYPESHLSDRQILAVLTEQLVLSVESVRLEIVADAIVKVDRHCVL